MNNTDPTSFKSILEGVKRLREQQTGSKESAGKSNLTEQQKGTSNDNNNTNRKVINAFNQERFPLPTNQNNGGNNDTSNDNGKRVKGKTVLINTTQRENPLLNHLKNTSWRYISSTPTHKIYYDYLIKDRSVLFLTLSYHKLYTDYISRSIGPLSSNNDNILLFVIDDNSTRSEQALTEITKLCMFNGFTLLVAFNFEQAAKYIEYLNS